MRSLAAIIALFYFANTMAAAPYGIKGQAQSGTLYSNVHQFPNNQVTNLGGINALVETGNNNILTNPSFEHLVPSTDWVGETIVGEAVEVIHGKKSAKIVLSNKVLNLTQDSTTYAAQFADGVQGLLTVRIKTLVSGLRVCARQAGVINTSLCVSVPSNGKWGLYKIPFILGATSNGLSINSNGVAVSGTVFLDDAYLGAQDVKQEVTNIGPWTSYTPTWTVVSGTNPAIGNGTITGKWRQVGDSIEVTFNISSGSTTTYGTGIYVVSLPPGLTIDTSKSSDDYGTSNIYSNSGGFQTYIGKVIGNTPTSMRFIGTGVSLWSNTVPVTLSASTTGHSFSGNFTVPVTQFSGFTSTYSSNNANYSPRAFTPAVIYNTGGATNVTWTGFESRNGNRLIVDIKGTFSATSAAFTVPRFTLPNGLLVDASKLPTGVNNFKTVGFGSAEDQALANIAVIPTYAGTPTFIQVESITNALPFVFNTNDTITIHYEVPIVGWENSNIIIGQFNGLESCTDSYECTDTFSAYVSSAAVVSSENLDFISGNCTKAGGTGQFTCPLKAGVFTVAPHCIANHSQTSTYHQTAYVSSSTTSSIQVVSGNNAVSADLAFTVICQKSGADYIGKTAKAVASDQNVRTPGVTNSIVSSVTTSVNCTTPTCAIQTNLGNLASSVTRAGVGDYRVNINPIYQGLVWACSCSSVSLGVGVNNCQSYRFDSSSFSVSTSSPAGIFREARFDLVCHGQLP